MSGVLLTKQRTSDSNQIRLQYELLAIIIITTELVNAGICASLGLTNVCTVQWVLINLFNLQITSKSISPGICVAYQRNSLHSTKQYNNIFN